MKRIHSDNAPEAIGPYSQAIEANGFVFCAGQIGVNKDSELAIGVENQTRQAIQNLDEVLKAAGLGLENIVKTTVYLMNIGDFKRMNVVYEEVFGEHKPARATVEVEGLPKNALVEIEAIAAK